jgi:hypothetical protein
MVMLAEPMQAQQAARVLRLELSQAAVPLQEPWPPVVPRPAAQRALRQPVWSALLLSRLL